MKLKEIIELKIETQEKIQKLIEDFVNKTDLEVQCINIGKDYRFGKGFDYVVFIDVKI
jgi:FAD synthase